MKLKSKTLIGALATALLAGTALFTAPAASAATPYCGIRWGSLYKSTQKDFGRPAWVTNVRAGRHACFDRVVVDVGGHMPLAAVGYNSPFSLGPLRGGADLTILMLGTCVNKPEPEEVNSNRGCDRASARTYQPKVPRELVNVTGYRTFRQVALVSASSDPDIFQHSEVLIGLGVRARLPFRVFYLDDGATGRLVIDVAHRW